VYVRGQLDRGELRYTWTDIDGNARASDDGGPVPPKGWWPRPEFTWINRETSEVRGHALFPPRFPPMFFVRVFPETAPKAKPKGRDAVKANLVWEILAAIDRGDEGLAPDLEPAEIDKKVLPRFLARWRERKPDYDTTKRPVSRREIVRTYQRYLQTILGKPGK
jgi:hypothetical protein